MTVGPTLVLASASPRRRDVLEQLGLEFSIVAAPPGTEKGWDGTAGYRDFAVSSAAAKRDAVAETRPESIVVAADTVVVLDGAVIEKPSDEMDARKMLAMMAGRRHDVCTGLAVAAPDGTRTQEAEITGVTFRDLSMDEIEAYVATGEPLDKAGAYGIQGYGATLVTSVSGCYYNVMGLPVALLLRLLREIGWEYRAPGRLRPTKARD